MTASEAEELGVFCCWKPAGNSALNANGALNRLIRIRREEERR
jgi:hypothetical protein